MEELIVASGNINKIKEITSILKDKYNVVSQKQVGIDIDVEETGETFYQNALLKAKAISEISGKDALADDSGLVVEALFGAPGVYSARYSNMQGNQNASDHDNNAKLLRELEGKTNRKAKFVSCVVLYKANGQIIFAQGQTEGEIMLEPKGSQGFGYDPLFFSYDLKMPFGEASFEKKNSCSHRARALKLLFDKI